MFSKSLLKGLFFTGLILACLYSIGQWKVKSNLDRLIKSSKYVADISYSNAELTFEGSVLIEGIRADIYDINAEITIEEIEYNLGNVFDLLFKQNALDEFVLPEKVLIRYQNARMVFSPRFVNMLASYQELDAKNTSGFSNITTLGCGQKMSLGIHDYIEMGYTDLMLSGDFNLQKTASASKLVSDVIGSARLEINNVSLFEYQWKIGNVVNKLSELSSLNIMPTLDSLSIDITDMGYNFRKNIYCAQQAETDTPTYLDNHIALVADTLNTAELKMTEQIQDKYRELLQPGSTVHLSIKPQPGFIFANLTQYNEDELRDILGLEITVNNFELPRMFTEWELEKFEEVVVLTPEAIETKRKGKIYQYVEKPLTSAQRYVRRQVKIETVNDLIFEGMLQEVNADTLRISVFHQTGTSIGPITKTRIKHFYLFQEVAAK